MLIQGNAQVNLDGWPGDSHLFDQQADELRVREIVGGSGRRRALRVVMGRHAAMAPRLTMAFASEASAKIQRLCARLQREIAGFYLKIMLNRVGRKAEFSLYIE